MHLDVSYLAHQKAVDLGPFLLDLSEEVQRLGVDTGGLKVTLDWVQYRQCFREVLEPRRASTGDSELAVDVRRLDDDPPVASALAYLGGDDDGRLVLEEFCRPPESLAWRFNRAYWHHLSAWEETFERPSVAALPGGVSDGANPTFWRERLEAFVDLLDHLERSPEEIYVLELGGGAGHQAKVWLDTFSEVCEQSGRDHHHRLRYLLSDFSPDVLRAARRTVADHQDKVSFLTVDAVDPLHALSFLRYKVLFIHSSNLYDNLPTEEVVRRDGALFEVQVRAYLPEASVEAICAGHPVTPDMLAGSLGRLLRLGPAAFDDEVVGVRFWADVWRALRLEERHVELDELGRRRLLDLPGVGLEELLAPVRGDIRLHLSTLALRSFANTLPLLHASGVFQVQDLFVSDLGQYRGAFRGPGKMDGSIVNWLNGPLFRLVGEHLGYTVHFEPFRHRAGSHITVLTTSPKP